MKKQQNMKILVTGGLGFIGSNFILHVLQNKKDIEIINLDAEIYGSNKKNLENLQVKDRYKFVKGNITDSELMGKLIAESDAVINFAAESFVDRSIANASPFFESNVRGVFNILEILKNSKKRFLQISTDEVFGSLQENSAVEETRFNPSSPYAATKAAAELLINSYGTTFDCNYVITRCTNNFGPRQFPEKLIPKVILLASQDKPIPVYGNGKNIRDWIFVEDHCKAILNVLENGNSNTSYNISSENEIDNLTIIEKILEVMKKPKELITFVEDRPGHDYRYSMKSDKIKNELQWKPEMNFDSALKETVEWYLKNESWWNDLSPEFLNITPWKN